MRSGNDAQIPEGNHGNKDGLDWDEMIAELQAEADTAAGGTEQPTTPAVSHHAMPDLSKGPAIDHSHDAPHASGVQAEQHPNDVAEILKALDLKGIVKSACSRTEQGAVVIVAPVITSNNGQTSLIGGESSLGANSLVTGAFPSDRIRIGKLEDETAEHRYAITRLVELIANGAIQIEPPHDQVESRK